jgi:hypothetical protein
VLIERYRDYLTEERGLEPVTVANYVRVVTLFLAAQTGRELAELSAAEVSGFMTSRCRQVSTRAAERLATGLRSFLGFALVEGLISMPLVGAVPSVARWSGAGLPRGLTSTQNLRAQGKGIKTIMRELGLAKETVRRFARAATVEELLATARDGRASVLDEFKPYLHHRFNLGHTNGSLLFAEIREQGYRGSLGTVLGYLRPFRASAAAPPAVPRPPTVRDTVGMLPRHPDTLDADDQLTLKQVRARCPHLDDVADHVSGFAEMMVGRHGERLDAWIDRVEADDQPDLHRFANGVRRDHDAVLNGLTLEHSSGAVEGSVNRIKMIKRQMYGRAGFELLRKRVLLAS